MIHWISTITALLGVYSIAGMLYSWWAAGPDPVASGAALWAALAVNFFAASSINVWRVRSKRTRKN